MSVIQVRLNQSQFQKRVSEFIGKQISIVFVNDTVSFGLVQNIKGNVVTLQNMRLKKTNHLISDINEVYFDKNA